MLGIGCVIELLGIILFIWIILNYEKIIQLLDKIINNLL
jgi:hypothetical protein